MRILLVGATGTIGSAVATALSSYHEIIGASRSSGDVRVDISDPTTIRAMYSSIGQLDAVVCCGGAARRGPLESLSDDDFTWSLANKLLGQINLVRYGLGSVRDGGSFTLTAGIY